MKHIVTFNGITYIFTKDEIDEPYEHFVNRVWWIVKNIHLNQDVDKTYIHNMSFLWSNVYHMGVVYSDEIMTELDKYTKSCFD